MTSRRDLKAIQERTAKALQLKPEIGQGTAITTVRVRGASTACDIEDGAWKLVADMDKNSGGESLGPDPGVLVRAGLGSCLAIGYALWAARMEIPLDDVQVTIESDYDARGMYAVGDSVSPGWGALRCTVAISSPAPEERIREMVDAADRHSPVLDDITRALAVRRELRIAQTVRE